MTKLRLWIFLAPVLAAMVGAFLFPAVPQSKVFEAADKQVFSWGCTVSSRTLKHVAVAISSYWILHMLEWRSPVAFH